MDFAGDAMEFRILGPLQVVAPDGQPVTLGPRERKVLAVLLLAAGRPVPVHELIDAVWDGDPPATARRQIQNSISILRKRMPIPADGPGYRIPVDSGRLDAQVFADLVARAQVSAANEQAGHAVQQLASALRLWRGPALVDISGRAIEVGVTRLNEQRLAAIEQRVELELQLGRHDALVGELTELVATYPVRERMVGQLMRALHACGRRADALAAYGRLRIRLADDLGIDPTPELRQLHAGILRDQADAPSVSVSAPASAATSTVPRQLPAPARHFVGRAGELADLDRLVDESGQPTGTVVISAIDGTGGIGKTALALHWAHRIAARFPDGQLYVDLRGFHPNGSPMLPGEAIRVFLDAFAVPPERIPASLDAQAALYRSLIAGRRMLVVLDNAHDAEQVRPLLPGSATCLALVTSRRRLIGLVAVEGAHPITLDLLTQADAYDLLARYVGVERLVAEPDATRRVIDQCARLPLALAIAAARALEHPASSLSSLAADLADTRRRLDTLDAGDQATQVRAVFSWSYERLSAGAAELFRLLGLHPGPDISAPAAASLTGRPVPVTRSHLDELIRSHLLVEHTAGRFTYHDLLRAYAQEAARAVDPEDRRDAAIHRMLDHYLHTGYAAERLLDPDRDPISLPPPAPALALEDVTNDREAMDWLVREHAVVLAAVKQAADAGWDEHAWRLAWTLANFLYRRGQWTEFATTQQAAVVATGRLANFKEQARAYRNLGQAQVLLGHLDAAEANLRQALDLAARVGDPATQAAVLLGLGHLSELRGRHGQAVEHAREALALYRAADHPAGQARALNQVGWYNALLGDHQQALTHCQWALDLFRKLGNRDGEASTWDSLGYAHHGLGHTEEAIACYERAIDLDRSLGNRYHQANTLERLGDTHDTAGDRAAARAAWQQALTILTELGHPDVESVRTKLDH